MDRSPAQFHDVAQGVDVEGGEQLLGQGTGRHAHRRLAGAGPFQDPADRSQVLDGAGQIAVPGPRPLQIVQPLELVVAVDHLQRDRAAERRVLPDARQDFHAIRLNPLPPAAPVAPLPTSQFDVDRIRLEGHAGRKSIHDRQQCLAVGFTGCPVTQHRLTSQSRHMSCAVARFTPKPASRRHERFAAADGVSATCARGNIRQGETRLF